MANHGTSFDASKSLSYSAAVAAKRGGKGLSALEGVESVEMLGNTSGFTVVEGETISFPAADELCWWVETELTKGKAYDYLYMGGMSNKNGQREVPMWIFRQSDSFFLDTDAEAKLYREDSFKVAMDGLKKDKFRLFALTGLTLKCTKVRRVVTVKKDGSRGHKNVACWTVVLDNGHNCSPANVADILRTNAAANMAACGVTE